MIFPYQFRQKILFVKYFSAYKKLKIYLYFMISKIDGDDAKPN